VSVPSTGTILPDAPGLLLEPSLLADDDGDVKATTKREHFLILLRRSLLLKLGVALVILFVFLAAFGPIIGEHIAPLTTTTNDVSAAPSSAHLFGTDGSGFDVLARVLASTRIDVTIALVATALSLVLGSLIGLLTSFFRGVLGDATMRISDTIQAFPLLVLALIFVVMAGRSYAIIVLVIALVNVPIYLRLIRSEVLSLRERTFVEAARANGDTGMSIAVRHVLPNALSPAFAQAPITLGQSIVITAGLSFLGAGVQPPTPEWGSMIAAGSEGIVLGQWWGSVFPGLAMSLCVFGFAVVGEALETVLTRRNA
jgi:peptide/nickel transport system permease protein